MLYIAYLIHLSFFTIIAIFMGIFSKTTIQLLLVVVIIVFFQGLILIALGNSIIGTYLMIIYIGAIVILFAFCILFINTKEFHEKEKHSQLINSTETVNIFKILFLIFIFIFWEIISYIGVCAPQKKEMTINYSILSESNYMLYFSSNLYSTLIISLFIMILILLLGLILTIKIIKNK